MRKERRSSPLDQFCGLVQTSSAPFGYPLDSFGLRTHAKVGRRLRTNQRWSWTAFLNRFPHLGLSFSHFWKRSHLFHKATTKEANPETLRSFLLERHLKVEKRVQPLPPCGICFLEEPRWPQQGINPQATLKHLCHLCSMENDGLDPDLVHHVLREDWVLVV